MPVATPALPRSGKPSIRAPGTAPAPEKTRPLTSCFDRTTNRSQGLSPLSATMIEVQPLADHLSGQGGVRNRDFNLGAFRSGELLHLDRLQADPGGAVLLDKLDLPEPLRREKAFEFPFFVRI